MIKRNYSPNHSLNQGKCMAPKNKKNNKKICLRKVKNNTDFCGYHLKSKEYHSGLLNKLRRSDAKKYKIDTVKLDNEIKKLLINENILKFKQKMDIKINNNTNLLNSKHDFMLMDIKDGWEDVPYCYRIHLSDEWWDITILLEHMTSQLNQSDMENPYPIYPCSPFTRILFTINDIQKIKKRIIDVKLKVNIACKIFINSDINKLKQFYLEASQDHNSFSSSLLEYLKTVLRYRLTNNLNSQSQFTGYWVRTNEPINNYEKLYESYTKMSPEVYDYMTGNYIQNYDRDFIYILLVTSKSLEWDTTNDHTIEYL